MSSRSSDCISPWPVGALSGNYPYYGVYGTKDGKAAKNKLKLAAQPVAVNPTPVATVANEK